jgi:BirA family biotin operon repressor/biotin-[acetyl-CoA-carboxylase] ligase
MSTTVQLHIVEETPSTNSALAAMSATAPHGYAILSRRQTAGRGQRGNSWEAAPGLNVTLSLLLRPTDIDAASQFTISEAVAIGVAETIAPLLPGKEVRLKWPNDVYVDNRKICGILIENSLSANKVDRSIAGIGLNVNQEEFLSDAPNPVSLRQLTGCTFDVEEIATRLCNNILAYLQQSAAELHSHYKTLLWRGEGMHLWTNANGRRFEACIADIATTGHLTLEEPDGTKSTYAFKEVSPVM